MQNSSEIEADSNIIFSIYHGSQTAQAINDVANVTKGYVSQLRSQHKPVNILIDASDIQGQDLGARMAGIDAIKNMDYDKLALFNAPLVIKYVVLFLITASGKQDKVKYFETQDLARQWLTEPQGNS